MKNWSKLFVVFTLVIFGVNQARAQRSLKDDEAKKATEVKNLVDGGRYTFEATKLVSGKSDSKPLTGRYDLDISKDTLIANLPSSGSEGIRFTCTHFAYSTAPGKKGHREITIQPNEKTADMQQQVEKLKLDISSLGYTTLTVIRTKQSPVSYYGYIKEHSAEFPPVSASIKSNLKF